MQMWEFRMAIWKATERLVSHGNLFIGKTVVSLSFSLPYVSHYACLRPQQDFQNPYAKPLLGSLYLGRVHCYDQWKDKPTFVNMGLNVHVGTTPSYLRYITA